QPRRGKPVQAYSEDKDRQRARPIEGQAQGEVENQAGGGRQRQIKRGERPQRDAAKRRDQQRAQGKRARRRELLRDDRTDGATIEQRNAEIAAQQPDKIAPVLLDQRRVQAERGTSSGNRFSARAAFAQLGFDGVAGQHAQREKCQRHRQP